MEPRPQLLGPDGLPLVDTADDEDPKLADRRRSIAAGACRFLIEAVPEAASRLVEALAKSLEVAGLGSL